MAVAPKAWAETRARHTMQRDGAMGWIVGFWCKKFSHQQYEC